MEEKLIYTDCVVSIVKRRWEIIITIVQGGRPDVTYVAAADAFHAEHDGIWFGTRQEWEEWEG